MFIGSRGLAMPPPALSLRRRSSSWSPTNLGALLVGWLHAEDLAAGAVSSWSDRKSGAAFVQATGANQPVASLTSFNGRPGVTFDGSNDQLAYTGIPTGWPTGAAEGEVWVLVSQDALAADATARTAVGYGGVTSATWRAIQRTVSGGVNRARISGAGSLVADATVDLSGRHNFAGLFPSGTMGITVDGGAVATTSVTQATGTTTARLGATSGGTLFWNGVISEVLVIAGNTDAGQRSSLAAYFAAKR